MADKIGMAREFVVNWVTEKINPTGYEPEGDRTEAEQMAFECWREADASGISRPAIQEAVGSLVDYMAQEIKAANDREIERQIAKHKD